MLDTDSCIPTDLLRMSVEPFSLTMFFVCILYFHQKRNEAILYARLKLLLILTRKACPKQPICQVLHTVLPLNYTRGKEKLAFWSVVNNHVCSSHIGPGRLTVKVSVSGLNSILSKLHMSTNSGVKSWQGWEEDVSELRGKETLLVSQRQSNTQRKGLQSWS